MKEISPFKKEHAGFGISLSGVSKKGFQQNKGFLVCWVLEM